MSIYFQEPSTDGAPGIWELEDAQRNQLLGKWPTIPATVPDWVKRGPDGALPIDQADFALGKGWFNGQPYPNLFAYMDAASGTFLRGSDGTYFDKNGILQTAGPNTLRLTHDPVTDEPLGYLAEGSRERPSLSPMNLGSSDWTKAPTLPVTEVPDERWGRSWKLTNTTGETARSILQSNVTAGKIGTPVTLAMIIKQAPGISDALIRLANRVDNTTSGRWIFYDPATRTITQATSGEPTDPLLGHGVIDLGDGWDLVWLCHSNGEDATHALYIRDQAAIAQDVALIAAAWAEYGEFPSSVITGESASIRNADNLSFARNSTPEFTVVFEGIVPDRRPQKTVWQWDSGSNPGSLHLYITTSGNLQMICLPIGLNNTMGLSVPLPGSKLKTVTCVSADRVAVSMNGNPATEFEPTGELPALNTFRLGQRFNTNQYSAPIARTTIYDRAYSNAQLEAMSAL